MIFLLFLPKIYSQDTFSGKYLAVDQAQYDPEKRWIEISRNKYQEIIVSSEHFLNVVAYYDADNQELYFVIEKPAQYNTFMKIKIKTNNILEVYMLTQNKWSKSEYTYKK